MHTYSAYREQTFVGKPTRSCPTPGAGSRRPKDRNPRHRVALIMSGIVLTAALAVVMPRVFSMTLTPSEMRYVEVTVAPGETLWDIASTHKPLRSDTRSMVYNIRTANELDDAAVYPGQVLRIPVGRR